MLQIAIVIWLFNSWPISSRCDIVYPTATAGPETETIPGLGSIRALMKSG